MLVKSGYDARIGFNNNQIYLLLPSVNTFYGIQYYVLDNESYYVTDFGNRKKKVNSMFTYKGNYKNESKLIDLNIYTTPDISKSLYQKKYKFTYTGKEYSLIVNVNKNVIDMYNLYPITNLDIYFKASISSDVENSLYNTLKPIIRNFSEPEAVNVLLRFTQNAFDYETDNEQFGREKPFFTEETIFYPYSDCEDRSVIFAYLVKNLLGLEVIGLNYPEHIATAIKFTENVPGDYVNYNNNKYIICDPTYLNANYGECMPKYKDITPKIIQF